jgi:hypothetical protein
VHPIRDPPEVHIDNFGTDYYQISVDTYDTPSVTIYPMMPLDSNLSKSVKVTSKIWIDAGLYAVASVIFYPAWEIPDPDDAKITN